MHDVISVHGKQAVGEKNKRGGGLTHPAGGHTFAARPQNTHDRMYRRRCRLHEVLPHSTCRSLLGHTLLENVRTQMHAHGKLLPPQETGNTVGAGTLLHRWWKGGGPYYIYMYIVRVCVCERESMRARGREREIESEREKETAP